MQQADTDVQDMSADDFIDSEYGAGDLALVFHASYERSGDGPKELQDRVDAAEKWYEYFSGVNPEIELTDFPK